MLQNSKSNRWKIIPDAIHIIRLALKYGMSSSEQIIYLIEKSSILKLFHDLLDSNDVKLIYCSLLDLEKLLERAKKFGIMDKLLPVSIDFHCFDGIHCIYNF